MHRLLALRTGWPDKSLHFDDYHSIRHKGQQRSQHHMLSSIPSGREQSLVPDRLKDPLVEYSTDCHLEPELALPERYSATPVVHRHP